MTKAFESKVIRCGIVDTEKYRYKYVAPYFIIRIELDCLGTTATLNFKSDSNPHGWEIVKQYPFEC